VFVSRRQIIKSSGQSQAESAIDYSIREDGFGRDDSLDEVLGVHVSAAWKALVLIDVIVK
jgi:hypothetical protein